jgi:glycosyltransferase involved in cell wall biosynthesis
MLAGLGETWVITSPYPKRTDELEAGLKELPEGPRIHIVYADIPRWIRRLLGEPSGPRLQRLEYVLWQVAALGAARQLQRKQPFDLVWHLTWANVWIGSFASLLGLPFVLGPVGGGVNPPWRLVPSLGLRGATYEVIRAIARALARYLNPLGRITWSRARLILVQNPETLAWLPKEHHSKTVVFPNVVLEEPPRPRTLDRKGEPTALFVGRLLPLKGVSFAIEAISLLPNWQLTICGAGPDGGRLERVAQKFGVEKRVHFLGWRPREEALRLMREDADVFLFPSLHDEGSWVVAEAVACGLPVVCLARGGPAVLAGDGVPATTPGETVRRLAEAVRTAGKHPLASPPRTDLESSRARLADLLRRAGLLGGAEASPTVEP